jgi:hypothetical protein
MDRLDHEGDIREHVDSSVNTLDLYAYDELIGLLEGRGAMPGGPRPEDYAYIRIRHSIDSEVDDGADDETLTSFAIALLKQRRPEVIERLDRRTPQQ